MGRHNDNLEYKILSIRMRCVTTDRRPIYIGVPLSRHVSDLVFGL